MKPRRSMLFIPGANAAMLSTSFVYGADAVMFDLEDAVSLREKDTARLLVYQALQHPLYQDIETVVRINPLNTPFGLADLEAVVRAGVDMVRLPKTDSKEDIHELEAHVERIERECGREVGSTKLMAAIESALGVVNAVETARASPPPAATVLNCSTPAALYCMPRALPASPPMTWCGRISITKRASWRKRIWPKTSVLTANRWLTHDKLNSCIRSMPRRAKRSITRWK